MWVMPTVPWKKARPEDHYCDQWTSHQQHDEDNRPTADCQYAEQGNDHEEQDRRVFMLHDSPSFAGIEQLDRVAVADDWARDERLVAMGRRSAHLVTVGLGVQTPRRQWV